MIIRNLLLVAYREGFTIWHYTHPKDYEWEISGFFANTEFRSGDVIYIKTPTALFHRFILKDANGIPTLWKLQ